MTVRSAITARLTPGNGQSQWRVLRSSDTAPVIVFFRCPLCNAIGEIPGSSVMADGMTAQQVECSSRVCMSSYLVFLDGWAQRAETKPRPNSVEHPGVFQRSTPVATWPLCQADGSGQ